MLKVLNRVREMVRTGKRNANRWVAESPSTRDSHLIWYQVKKQGLRRALMGRPYNEVFFEEHVNLKPAYQELAELIFERFRPSSVCDFGCGNGFLLYFLAEKGVEVSGIEGSQAALQFIDPKIRDRIVTHDLTKPINPGKYDLIISTEVAEHLPKKASLVLVQNLTRSATGTIVFTAAKPGQWGDGHINCQPKEFWINLFDSCGWTYDSGTTDAFTTAVKRSPAIANQLPWIMDNFIILGPTSIIEPETGRTSAAELHGN